MSRNFLIYFYSWSSQLTFIQSINSCVLSHQQSLLAKCWSLLSRRRYSGLIFNHYLLTGTPFHCVLLLLFILLSSIPSFLFALPLFLPFPSPPLPTSLKSSISSFPTLPLPLPPFLFLPLQFASFFTFYSVFVYSASFSSYDPLPFSFSPAAYSSFCRFFPLPNFVSFIS